MIYQRTIAKKISVTGIGLHSGDKVTLSLCPAESNYGIRFQRIDLPHHPFIEASVDQVSATANRTTMASGLRPCIRLNTFSQSYEDWVSIISEFKSTARKFPLWTVPVNPLSFYSKRPEFPHSVHRKIYDYYKPCRGSPR